MEEWIPCNSETFWREVAPHSHVLQLYDCENELLNLLEGFVAGGISVGECIILIATKEHLQQLEKRLSDHALDIPNLKATNQYIALDASETLSKFMVNGVPDEDLFRNTIAAVFDSVRPCGKRIRAFGEMVAILWEQGNQAATIELEHMWNSYFEREVFSLLCTYPKNQFSKDGMNQLAHICKAHATMVSVSGQEKFDLCYHKID
ncbi:MEDS domain-containing protein [Pontibacter sp. CAU 1760]